MHIIEKKNLFFSFHLLSSFKNNSVILVWYIKLSFVLFFVFILVYVLMSFMSLYIYIYNFKKKEKKSIYINIYIYIYIYIYPLTIQACYPGHTHLSYLNWLSMTVS